LKEQELRGHDTCSICKRKIGHTGLPLFWTVEIKRYGIKMGAVQRQDGLAMMMGSHAALAAVMGPNEDMAECIATATLTVCETCAVEENLPVAVLLEQATAPAD